MQEIPIDKLRPFKNHPFKIKDDELMQRTVESIQKFGVLSPGIVRPTIDGCYEIIAGHRRCHALELLEKTTMPVIVRDMDDDAAIILMVDSNLQRESILPSERAFAYKMKLDAIKHQGKASGQLGQLSVEVVAQEAGESYKQVQRFIRLTALVPKLLDMVDSKVIAFNPAVELSYLSKDEQERLLEAMEYAQATPSLSQAQRMKKLSSVGKLTEEVMRSIMSEEKKTDLDKVTLSNDILRKYFPRSYTPRQMQETIIALLEQWQRKKQQKMER